MSSFEPRGLKKLDDGRWQYSWMFQGKYHRKIARTKTEAQTLLESIRTKIREGRYLDVKKQIKRVSFSEAVDRYLAFSKGNLRPATVRDDVRFARRWRESKFFSGKKLDEITPDLIERYKQLRSQDLSRSRRAKSTRLISRRAVDSELSRLKRLFSLAVQFGLCEFNPAAKVKLYREDNKRVRYLTDEQERRLMGFLSPWLTSVVRFDLHTGLRKGELLGLRWSDIDFQGTVLTIPASRAKGKRDRHVPLNRTARLVLTGLRSDAPEAAAEALVFGSPKGKPRVSFHKEWRKALLLAGISDFRFHDLRHTYASRLAMAGRPLTEIMRLMGHQSYELTLRYAHLSPTSLQEAVDVLDKHSSFPSTELTGNDPVRLQ